MLEPFTTGLSGAVVGGLVVLAVVLLTILAFRNPAAYRKLGLGLAVCFMALFAGGMGWNLAITAAMEAVPLKQNGARIIDSLDALRTPEWIVYSVLGLSLYLWGLPVLGKALGRGEDRIAD